MQDDEQNNKLQQCLKEFQEILLSIPDDEKRAYLQALDRCPELIERESSPELFLKYKDFQVWAAVQNLVEFWELRVEIYKERAFLPINFTGKGALDEDDLTLLEAGEFCCLPDDIYGNPTILICPRETDEDLNRFLKECCCVSFALRLICAHRQAAEGYNVIYIPSQVSAALLQMPSFARFLRTHDLIPAKQRGLFTLMTSEGEVASGMSANKNTVWNYVKPLSGESPSEIFQKLKDGGFRKEGIPAFLGGTWDATEFFSWFEKKREEDYSSSCMEMPEFISNSTKHEETASDMDEKLREFQRILETLSIDEKQAYLKARERCPHLIERESHPLLFLRHESFDVCAAVQKFVGFWELRVSLFTEERAFLPLNLTGKGAIDEETCRWIESGAVAILPKDDRGNAQLLLDTTLCVDGDHRTVAFLWLKALFFLRVLVVQRATSEGFAVLYFHNEIANSVFQAYASYEDKFDRIPQHFRGFWAIVPNKQTAEWLEANEAGLAKQTKAVFGETPQEIAEKLELEGFKREGLPQSIGGSWSPSAFMSWVKSHRNTDPSVSLLSPPTYAIEVAGPSEKSEKLREFYAILSSLPTFEKRAYLKALEQCPELTERECPPKLFLKAKNYHVWAAVRDYVDFWELRHRLFGERAFLPINLTGKGALDQSAIDLYTTGEVAFLPCKDDGKLFMLHASASSQDDVEVRVYRVLRAFFALRIIVSYAAADFAIIEKFSDVDVYMCTDPEAIRDMKSFQCIPPDMNDFIPILTVDSEEARRDFHKGVSAYKENLVWQGLNPFVAISNSEICENLRRQGLRSDCLPECLGGSWDISNMASWVREHENDDPGSSLLLPPKYACIDRMDTEMMPDESGEIRYPVLQETNTEEALARLEEIIRLLPEGDEKAAYKQAFSQVPDIILSESNPLWYLRAASFDAWDAGKRLTTYWYFRKKWFGSRAYLPLDLSGNGALTVDDVEIFRDGTAQLLPCDEDGRPVVFFRRLPSHSDESSAARDSRLRILFYLMTLAHKMERCQNLGIVLIIYYGEDLAHFRPFDWRESEIFTNTGVASRNTKGYLLSPQGATTGPAQPQIIKEFLTRAINILPLSNLRNENMVKMRAIGLAEAGIPEDLGGSWYPANFEDWLEQQHSVQTMSGITEESSTPQGVPPIVGSVAGPHEQYILLARLETALSDIGLNEKIDLLIARERAPALVASESPPARFLRCENFDFAKAARRWCLYWKGRKLMFGSKALLSLKSYEAVLNQQEKVYADGMVNRSLGMDSDGRSIIAFSGRKPAESGLNADSLARCYFVVFQSLIGNDMNQTDGIVLFREWIPSKFMPSCFKRMDEIITGMMPVRLFAHHLLCILPEFGKLSFYQSISSRLFGLSSEALAQKTNVHLADNREGLKELMMSLGMDLSRLPEILSSEVWGSSIDSTMSDSPDVTPMDDDTVLSHESPRPSNEEFGVAAIEECMANFDSSESAAFFEALRAAPNLVEKESNPKRFLALEGYRRNRAARRLCRYWTERKRIFCGRAFLPLDQTGEGALCKDDIAVLNSGFLSVLRNDSQNVPVGIFDGARAVPQQIEISERIMFYVGQILCEYDVEESLQCRFIVVASVLSLDCGLDKLLAVIEAALPTRINDINILPAACERGKASFYDSVAPQVIKLLGPRLGAKTFVVKGDTAKKRGEEMVKHGFIEKALPAAAGGEWNFAQFFQWQETRIRIEWGLPLSTVQKASIPKGLSYNVPNLSELPEDEQTERKRRLNLLHSRRKREKERAQIEALQDQVADLEEINRKEKEENSKLEQALRQASQYLPASSSPPESPMEDRKVSSGQISSFHSDLRNSADSAFYTPQDSADHDVFADATAVAAPSSGNKRILEEFLLQQQRVSVPSNVWMNMMNQTDRQQNDALRQFLSNMNGRPQVIGAPAAMPGALFGGLAYPPPSRDVDSKRRRF